MCEVIAIDLETFRFEPGNMAPKPVCLSFALGKSSGVYPHHEIEKFMMGTLDHAINRHAIIIGHFVAYDFACLLAHYENLRPKIWQAYDRGQIQCTRVREKLLDIAQGNLRGSYNNEKKWAPRGYTLEEMAERYLGEQLDKSTHRLKFGELYNVPMDQWPKGAEDYARKDAEVTLRVYQEQDERAVKARYALPDVVEQTKADLALNLTSVWGVHTDPVRVQSIYDQTSEKMLELEKFLVREGIMGQKTARGKVTKNLKVIRDFVKSHIDKPPLTPKGDIQTGKEVLEEIDHPIAKALIEFNSLQKDGSTYIKKLFEGIEQPIHANFDVLGAESGRTSCRAPNLQNQPRLPGIRECFVPRDGSVFLACDFDSQEMRTLAQACLKVCGRSKLAERYQEDTNYDPHQEFADVSGFSRQESKCASFGFPGGLGIKGFVRYAKNRDVEIGFDRAEKLREMYFEQWPEMGPYFEHIRDLVGPENCGDVVQLFSGRIRGMCGYTDAANAYFQGLAADASKAALFEVVKRCYSDKSSALWNCRPVNFVHDEIILEADEEQGAEAAKEIEKVMVETMARYTPDVPPSASAHLMRYWSKKAKPIYDTNGKLVPWIEDEKETA